MLVAAVWSGRIHFPGKAAIDPAIGPRGTLAQKITHYDESVQSQIEAVVERIKVKTQEVLPKSMECFGDPATSDEIAWLESQLGYPLPGQLKALLKMHNGQKAPQREFLEAGWRFHSIDSVASDSGETISWVSPEGSMPRPGNNDYGNFPGFVVFMSNDYEFLGLYLEDGKVYELDPESGYSLHADSLHQWLENIALRLENGQYEKSDDEFYLLDSKGNSLSYESPGKLTQ